MPELKHFNLPDVGEGLTEAEILNWHVGPGDTVTQNQVIVEIETAKAAVELPCPYPGKVTELLAETGQTVEVGAPIVVIDLDPDGAHAQPASSASTGEKQEATTGSEQPTEQGKIGEKGADGRIATLVGYGPRSSTAKRRPRKDVTAAREQDSMATGTRADEDRRANGAGFTDDSGGYVPLAKPPVRKLAKDLGVNLRDLSGSGDGGVITRGDVRAAADDVSTVDGAKSWSQREHREPIRGVRKATAEAVTSSAFTAPHVTEFLTVDVTPMMELRARLAARREFAEVKLTPLAFAAKALCMAIRRTPDVNATWDEDAREIVYKDYVHLGIAAATPRGLVVPKIFDADQMSLAELATSIEQLAATARDGKTPPESLRDGTITITNVGVFGVDTGTPILNPGESAILALGSVREMPWVVDGAVVPRKVCQLALSFDHRVVDGQQGSEFLADIGTLFADPGMAITF